ncbi:MAG TPA: carbonic anhydrase [Tepidiformaceae bacterium]|nr:carbonic anhydrase [Tepidiformaceae bacterium]
MSAIDELIAANKEYAGGLGASNLPLRRGGTLAIVTCMDVRIETGVAFGLREGDAYMVRNAGGRLAPAIPSLVVSQELLGTDALAIVHHSDCGMTTFTDGELRARLAARGLDTGGMEFGTFTDIDESVREDLRAYRACPLLRQDIEVRGFVFQVESGLLREIVTE